VTRVPQLGNHARLEVAGCCCQHRMVFVYRIRCAMVFYSRQVQYFHPYSVPLASAVCNDRSVPALVLCGAWLCMAYSLVLLELSSGQALHVPYIDNCRRVSSSTHPMGAHPRRRLVECGEASAVHGPRYARRTLSEANKKRGSVRVRCGASSLPQRSTTSRQARQAMSRGTQGLDEMSTCKGQKSTVG